MKQHLKSALILAFGLFWFCLLVFSMLGCTHTRPRLSDLDKEDCIYSLEIDTADEAYRATEEDIERYCTYETN